MPPQQRQRSHVAHGVLFTVELLSIPICWHDSPRIAVYVARLVEIHDQQVGANLFPGAAGWSGAQACVVHLRVLGVAPRFIPSAHP